MAKFEILDSYLIFIIQIKFKYRTSRFLYRLKFVSLKCIHQYPRFRDTIVSIVSYIVYLNFILLYIN